MDEERRERVALEAVAAAAALCERVRAQDLAQGVAKADRSPVTLADYGAQALVCRRLAAAFPDEPIVAEEDAAALAEPGQAALLARAAEQVAAVLHGLGEAPPRGAEEVRAWIGLGGDAPTDAFWTLDPIDGTKGYLRGDQYAVALAWVEDGRPRLAAMACPALPGEEGRTGLLLSARRGAGGRAWPGPDEAPRALRVAAPEDAAAARLVESVEAAHGDPARQEAVARAAGLGAAPLRMDSQAKYAALALGRAALYLRLPSPQSPDYRERIWDHAAGALLVEEAGGRVTDLAGRALDFSRGRTLARNRGIVASRGPGHEEVLAALAG